MRLGRLAASVPDVQPDPPDWVNVADQDADAWLWMAGATIAAPLIAQRDGAMLATSLLVKGSLSDEARRHRSKRAASRRAGKRVAKLKLDGQRRGGLEVCDW